MVGRVARFDPMKGYPQLIRAMASVARQIPRAHLMLVGRGIEAGQEELDREIAAAGLAGKAPLLGERSDIPRLLSSMDVFCSSSLFGEGFPMWWRRLLACGIPCVVTDVGIRLGSSDRRAG